MVRARASGGLQVQNRDGISRSVSRSVAQPGRAPRSGRGGRRFKSCHSDHFFRIWQFFGNDIISIGMGRKRRAPRLWLDQRPGRGWVILDGPRFIRTGCAESDRAGAEKQLAEYLGAKHKPQLSDDPLIADILNVYITEHLAHTRSVKNAIYNVESLVRWWGTKKLLDINTRTCRDYTASKSTPTAARRDLEVLRAAINHWHLEYGPLPTIPRVALPPKPAARERWMSRDEVARLLWQGRHTPHLGRFILLGVYTGSRSGVLLNLEWSWIDLKRGVMARRGPGSTEAKNKRTPKVRLGRRILAHLKRWRKIDGPHGKYVVHYNGQKIDKLRRSFPAAVKAAKLRDVTPHILRHSRATWLMQEGIDPWEAAGHLGMTVETLTRVYGHHHPDFQRSAAEV
jgi:integrase